MTLRSNASSDFYPTLRSGTGSDFGNGGQILGTLVYIVKHDKVSGILNENELICKLDLMTDYKQHMGGNWERCPGELYLYQLDGPEGHRFVISLHWHKKWFKKLRKVFGVKISCVERHSLLEILCLIEESRRMRSAYMQETMEMIAAFEASSRQIDPIEEEPELFNDSDDYETLRVKNNNEISIIPADSSKTKTKEPTESKEALPNETKSTEADPVVPKAEDEIADSVFNSSVETNQSGEELEKTRSNEVEQNVSGSDINTNDTIDDALKTEAPSNPNQNNIAKIPNGTIHEVEIHKDPSTPPVSRDSMAKRPSKAFTIDEPLSGYDESSGHSESNSRRSSSSSQPSLNKHRNLNESRNNDAITSDPKPLGMVKKQSNFTRSMSDFDNPGFSGVQSRRYEIPDYSGRSDKSVSIFGRLLARVKRKKSTPKSMRNQRTDKSMSKLALHETSSLKSSLSYDALSMMSFGTIRGSTNTLHGNRNYNRKYFKRRPASMHVLTRDRKLVPIYDVINCLLEFHDVMKPVKIIGVNSETPHSDDLAENQIMEFVYFLQKPANLELRLTRRDYVLYNSVVKLRSFANTELKILFA